MTCSPYDRPWYVDPSVLIKRPLEFFPSRGMQPEEHLNAIVRFVIYASIATALYQNMLTPLLFGCVCVVIVSLLYSIRRTKLRTALQTFRRKGVRAACTKPTEDNPFMNVLPHEFGQNKPDACPQTPCIEEKINEHFDSHVIREVSDVYKKRASDRQFVTMPVTGNGTPDTFAFRNYLFSQVAKGTRCK
jgi:hypothetical protein